MKDYIKEAQEFLARPEVAHTLKFVPQSQRELFASELLKHIAALLTKAQMKWAVESILCEWDDIDRSFRNTN